MSRLLQLQGTTDKSSSLSVCRIMTRLVCKNSICAKNGVRNSKAIICNALPYFLEFTNLLLECSRSLHMPLTIWCGRTLQMGTPKLRQCYSLLLITTHKFSTETRTSRSFACSTAHQFRSIWVLQTSQSHTRKPCNHKYSWYISTSLQTRSSLKQDHKRALN